MKIFFSTLLFLVCFGVAGAQSCTSAPSVVSDLNGKIANVLKAQGCALTDPNNFNQCMDEPGLYANLKSQMNTYFNSRSSNWSSIGPRRLDFGTYEEGRIVSTGGRMYISAVPSNKNLMTVDIKELDGKGKVSYVICKVDRKGNYTKLAVGWINEINSQKSDQRETRQHTIRGVKGHLISVHFDGKSVGNTFQYKVKVQ